MTLSTDKEILQTCKRLKEENCPFKGLELREDAQRCGPMWTRACFFLMGQPTLLPDFFHIWTFSCLQGFDPLFKQPGSPFLEEKRAPLQEIRDSSLLARSGVIVLGETARHSSWQRHCTPPIGQMDNPRSPVWQLLHRFSSAGARAPPVITFSWLALTSESRWFV